MVFVKTSRSHYYTRIWYRISHFFGHKVVAEGVETQKEVALLEEWGVDLIQGYYYTRPLSRDDLLSFKLS